MSLPINMEMISGVSVVTSNVLQARGAVFRAQVAVPSCPIMFGYAERQFPLYFRSAPLLQVGGGGGFGGVAEAVEVVGAVVALGVAEGAIPLVARSCATTPMPTRS